VHQAAHVPLTLVVLACLHLSRSLLYCAAAAASASAHLSVSSLPPPPTSLSLSCSIVEEEQRRRGNSSPPAAAPRADGEEGRGRRSGSCPARWRTRGGGGETAAHRRLLLARMGKRGGGGGASPTATSPSGAGEPVRAGEQVGPSSPRAFLSLLSYFSRAPLSTCALLDLGRIGRQSDVFRTPQA
jgi:hypothetical protein